MKLTLPKINIDFELLTKCPRDGHDYLSYGFEVWWKDSLAWHMLFGERCPICRTKLIRKPQGEVERFFS